MGYRFCLFAFYRLFGFLNGSIHKYAVLKEELFLEMNNEVTKNSRIKAVDAVRGVFCSYRFYIPPSDDEFLLSDRTSLP